MKKYRVTVNGTVYEVELEELTGSAVALQTSCEKFSYNLQKRNGA